VFGPCRNVVSFIAITSVVLVVVVVVFKDLGRYILDAVKIRENSMQVWCKH